MTGLEFRIIRRFNRISQTELADQISRSRFTIASFERDEFVPPVAVKALSNSIGIDLSDPKIFLDCLRSVPRKYFEAECPRHTYAMFNEHQAEFDKWMKSIQEANPGDKLYSPDFGISFMFPH